MNFFRPSPFLLFMILSFAGGSLFATVRADPSSDGMRAYADVLRAEGAFLVDVSMARLNFARANLVDAQAAFEWQRARMLAILVDRLEYELRHLRQDEHHARVFIKQIDRAATQLGVINTGRTSQSSFIALRFLMIRVVPPNTIASAMTATVPSYSADNFVPNKKGIAAESFPGGNVGTLITFLEKKNYSLEPFRDGHVAILHAIQEMADAADEKLSLIREQIQQLRDDTLDIWKIPPGNLQPYPGMAKKPVNPTPGTPPTPDAMADESE